MLALLSGEARAESAYCYISPVPGPGVDVKTFDQIVADRVAKLCRPGDVVLLPASPDYLIGRYCDFERSIVRVSGGDVLCVFGAPRKFRTTEHPDG